MYVLGAEAARGKVQRFLASLLGRSAAHVLTDPAQPAAPQQPRRVPLLEVAAAAASVHAALAARRAAQQPA